MGRLSRGAALRAVNPNIIEFVEAAAVGDVRIVKKLVKAAKVEIDDGKCNTNNKPCSFFAQNVPGAGGILGSPVGSAVSALQGSG